LSNFFQKVGRVWGKAPRFYLRIRAFWEVWNLRTDKVVGKPKGLLLPKAKVLSVAIEKGSNNFKIYFSMVVI
jgi:hypothetical protein